MLILSKFKDYYDYLTQIYGVDKKVVYTRKFEEIDDLYKYNSKEEELEFSNDKYYRKLIISYTNIWFCDENYPFLKVEYIEDYKTKTITYYYNYEYFMNDWESALNLTYYKSKYQKDCLKKFFNTKLNLKLNTKYKSPQLIMLDTGKIYKDIILKDYFFQTVISPEQAYQRVSMWLNSREDPPQTIPTDLDRFEAKGFDRKTSFRKM